MSGRVELNDWATALGQDQVSQFSAGRVGRSSSASIRPTGMRPGRRGARSGGDGEEPRERAVGYGYQNAAGAGQWGEKIVAASCG